MDASPDVPLHRVLKELNWSGALRGVPKDGDVKSNTDPLTGLKSYSLRAQPRAGHICGVSFFAPSSELSERTHQYMGKSVFGCGVTSSLVSLPPNLRFVNDIHLMLPLDGDNLQTISCGEHWVLYTTADMPVEEFHEYYTDLMKASIPCNIVGGAEPFNATNATTFLEELGVDMDLMPGDRHSYISVMALDELVANTDNDNVRLFASLFSLHVRAMNMNFDDILKCGPIANMVSTALDVWTARDPYVVGPAQEAQHLLAGVLGFQPKGIVYKPFWAVHPFTFLDGHYNDELYDDAVRTNAQAFVGDESLKSKVRALALKMFADLETSTLLAPCKEGMVEHKGVTFKVACGIRNMSQRMTEMTYNDCTL
ncbi:hypothetical protein CEUSTIGMA_g2712.t1 [Chlamydomonas eustigma]|uniref:Uncharacterized protein n=1 Tax=Chlamydomonas eustigma TaxID=1157962 RepID=A0A250WWQ4_9CHLO|nr:hypothetical protein CEUSTIGMA_g2712.t1 [Chlamydomonas eustigma]|eukprot:GAX75267.1 hypothetical protein CEUSTIGMA_g2712.t1 [Chlamydomonas eustigma]